MYENEQNEREILQWRLVHNWYQEQLWVQLTILTCPILNLDRRKTLQQLAQGLEEVLPSEKIMMYKFFRTCTPEEEFINLNFQANLNDRKLRQNFIKNQNYLV